MTDLPDIKLKALVSFPATAVGGTGIDVTSEHGHYNIGLDFSEFEPPGIVTDYDAQHALLWDSTTNQYILVPARSICAGGAVPEAPLGVIQYGRQNATWTPISTTGGTPSTADPLMDGVADDGNLDAYSRGDHRHPADTSRLPRDGSLPMTGNLILNADPSDNLGAATKQYVDVLAAGRTPFLPRLYINGLEPALVTTTGPPATCKIRVPPGVCANHAGTELHYNQTNLDIDVLSTTGNLKIDKTPAAQNGMSYFVYLLRTTAEPRVMGAVLSTCRFFEDTPTSKTFTVSGPPTTICTSTAHGFTNAIHVVVVTSAGTPPAPLHNGTTTYFLEWLSVDTFALSATFGGPRISMTTAGTGVHTVTLEYVKVPAGFELWRKLPWGIPYDNTRSADGIAAFQVLHWPGQPTIRLTESEEVAAWDALDGATMSTSFADVDLSPFLPDNARTAYVYCVTRYVSAAGFAWLKTKGITPTGFHVGQVKVSGDIDTTFHMLATDSARRLQYKVTAGVRLNVYVLGYAWAENS